MPAGRLGRRGVTCYVQSDASRGLERENGGDLLRGRARHAAFVCLENPPWSGGGAGGVPGVRSFSERVRRHRRERAGGFVVHEPTSLAHFRQMLVLAAVDHRGGPGGTAAEAAPWALPHPLVASTHQSAPVLHPATAVGRPVGRTAFGAEGCPEHVHAADRRRSPVLSRGWRQFGRNTLRPSGRACRPR